MRLQEGVIMSKEKEYQITLKTSELEFIRRALTGINEFMECLNGWPNSPHEFELDGEQIRPSELDEKIFKQYYDGDGKLL